MDLKVFLLYQGFQKSQLHYISDIPLSSYCLLIWWHIASSPTWALNSETWSNFLQIFEVTANNWEETLSKREELSGFKVY